MDLCATSSSILVLPFCLCWWNIRWKLMAECDNSIPNYGAGRWYCICSRYDLVSRSHWMRWYVCVIFYSGKVEVAKPSKTQKFLVAVYCCHLLVTYCCISVYPLSYVTCIINQELDPIMYNVQVFCFVSMHLSVSSEIRSNRLENKRFSPEPG